MLILPRQILELMLSASNPSNEVTVKYEAVKKLVYIRNEIDKFLKSEYQDSPGTE